MPFLFVALSVLAVAAMAAAGASSQTPPLNPPPPTGKTVTMQPGEIWLVQGSRSDSPTDAMWESFHDKLAAIMQQMGATIGKLNYGGSDFSFQIQPTSTVVTIQVPMVDAQFTIKSAMQLAGATAVSGRGHGGGGHRGGFRRGGGIATFGPAFYLDEDELLGEPYVPLYPGGNVIPIRKRRRFG
jgi:hypothetical protein